jgi:hypothetical protein
MASKIRRSVADAKTQRVNIRLAVEAYRRLGVHSLMTGQTPGRLIEALIDQHLRDFRVQTVRSASVPSEGRLEIATDSSPASPETATAA